MSLDNPYAPPLADPTTIDDVTEYPELARRLTRFAASFLDGIIGMAIGFPMMYLLGSWDYVKRGQSPPFQLTIAGAVLGFAGFLLIHGYFLKTNGQTVGKKLTAIRISDLDGNVPDFARVILLRYLPISVVMLIPGIGPFLSLVDVLFIFRGDRRCIHDLIAGTQVVLAKKSR